MRTTLLAFLAVAGCHKPAETAPAQPDIAPARPLAQDVRGIVGHLQDEAAHRPKVGITAERLFDALDAAGMAVVDRTQYTGAVMKAAFCAGGHTNDRVVVAICEYASDDAAQAGLAFMNKTFPLATATRRAHGAAVMTVVVPPSAVATRADTAVTTFLAL